MHKVVIADSSCLIIFRKIGELELLHLLYEIASATLRDRISITPEIEIEFG